MAERDKNWREISASAEERLRQVADIHYFAIFPRGICCFHAIVFFPSIDALKRAEADRFDELARELITEAVREFRGSQCSEYDISVELDSYENVKRHYGGNYFNRLR